MLPALYRSRLFRPAERTWPEVLRLPSGQEFHLEPHGLPPVTHAFVAWSCVYCLPCALDLELQGDTTVCLGCPELQGLVQCLGYRRGTRQRRAGRMGRQQCSVSTRTIQAPGPVLSDATDPVHTAQMACGFSGCPKGTKKCHVLTCKHTVESVS